MPGKDISAFEFVEEVTKISERRYERGYVPFQTVGAIERQWKFLVPSKHVRLREELSGDFMKALKLGVQACEHVLSMDTKEYYLRRAAQLHVQFMLDHTYHGLQGNNNQVEHATAYAAQIAAAPLPTAIEGKISESFVADAQNRLSAQGAMLFGELVLLKDKSRAITHQKEGTAALLESGTEWLNLLQEYVNIPGQSEPENNIALNGLFKVLHFNKLLVDMHHSGDPSPRLIRFALERESNPGKQRKPRDAFSLVELTAESQKLLYCKAQIPSGKAAQFVSVPEVTVVTAAEHLLPLAETAPLLPKLFRKAISTDHAAATVQEIRKELDNYLGRRSGT